MAMTMTAVGELPAFSYPVIAWAPQAASGDPTDDATRAFTDPREVVTTYFPESDLRLGWTFVDVEGRCWEAVASRVAGRGDPWWTQALPKWIYSPKYRLAFEFVERTPMSFDAVKSRLHLAVISNPEHWRGHSRYRRKELGAANSLRDLVKSDEALAIEGLERPSLWRQWLAWEGRCSRLMFVIATAMVFVGEGWLLSASQIVFFPIWLAAVWAGIGLMISAVMLRLHDLRRSGWWTLSWVAFTAVCAWGHGNGGDGPFPGVAGPVWQSLTLVCLGVLAVWPGTRGPNRYGFAPRASAAFSGEADPSLAAEPRHGEQDGYEHRGG